MSGDFIAAIGNSFIIQNFDRLILEPLIATVTMVGVSALLAALVGIPLGVFLATSKRGELLSMPITSKVVGAVVNALRAVPFIILAVAMFPYTRMLVGTGIGTKAAIVPLTVAAIPFVARLVETLIREVDQGLVEAARAFGANSWQIIWKVLLPEARSGIALVLTLALISLIGFSAMVGAVGGGGLGDVALRWGYAQNKTDVMVAIVILLIVLNHLLQTLGESIARSLNKKVRSTESRTLSTQQA